MDWTLEKLKAGIRRFHDETYHHKADTYQKAASTPQRPHTLIIACADSRVDVETITASDTGEIFITRNVGNMAPAYGEMLGGVSAVIEYAVSALEVQHIAICGHSDCGAMKALLAPGSTDAMPMVHTWLRIASAALERAQRIHEETGRDLLPVLTEQNALLQVEHLRTHPAVAKALREKKLTLSAWVYEIGSGEIRISRDADGHFEVLTPGEPG